MICLSTLSVPTQIPHGSLAQTTRNLCRDVAGPKRAEGIHILFCADENYAPHLGTAIASILVNAAPTDRLHFHVLSDGLSPETERKLKATVEGGTGSIRFLQSDPDLREYATAVSLESKIHDLPKLDYYRLRMGSLFPELRRLLYLDCDLIVRGSLSPLWNTPLLGNTLAAVEDQGRGALMDSEKRTLGVQRYFNSGVLLVDLDAWRSRETEDRLREFGEKRRDIPRLWHDQTILNAVLGNEILFLPVEWNLMVHCLQEGRRGQPEAARGSVAHFTGNAKPWRYNPHAVPFSEEYWKYRSTTPWGKNFPFNSLKRQFLREKTRLAWRHPRDFLKSLVGLEAPWEPAIPKGLEP